MNSYVSVSEAARIKKVTRQAIYLAIRLKKLKAYRHDDQWRVFMVDLDAYDKKRYSRMEVILNGEPLFDESKGVVSVDKASQMIGVPKQKLYYAVRTGLLKSSRKRSSYLIKVEDLFAYEKEYLKKDFTAKKSG